MNNLYPWQTPLFEQITDAFSQGRGHHALLFKSEQGVGTDRLIEQFAHWLLCQNQQGSQACGQCKSCLLYQSGNHPDFHILQSIEGKEIGIDQVREINEKLQQFSQQGGNAVVYVKGAERLTEAASNAILKTLEEPHQKVYFLLESPLSGAILPTIQSRCQTWVVHTPDADLLMPWLQEHCSNYSEQEISVALKICHHRPLSCKIFLESDRLPQRKRFLQTFWLFYKNRDLLLFLKAFDAELDAVLQQLEWLDSFFADSLKAKMGITTGWVNDDLRAGIQPFSEAFSPQKLLAGHKIIQQTRQELLSINAVNIELMLADCLAKLLLDVIE